MLFSKKNMGWPIAEELVYLNFLDGHRVTEPKKFSAAGAVKI